MVIYELQPFACYIFLFGNRQVHIHCSILPCHYNNFTHSYISAGVPIFARPGHLVSIKFLIAREYIVSYRVSNKRTFVYYRYHMLLQSSLYVPSRSVNSHLMEQMRDMRQKVTQLEKANHSHVDNEELQVQVSCFFCCCCCFAIY